MALINGVNGVYDTELQHYVHDTQPVPSASFPNEEDLPVWARAKAKDVGEKPRVYYIRGDASNSNVVTASDALPYKSHAELPMYYLPLGVRRLVDTMATVLDCSEDIVISTMFAVVSGAVGTNIKVLDGKYTNMLNINVCHVAPPGSNKTQPVSLLVRPLEDISKTLNKNYKEEKRRCLEQKDFDNIPTPRILYVTNSTPEAINKMLAYNSHGLFLRRDELTGFIDDLAGRYSRGNGGIPDFLSFFTNESVSIIRAGDDPLVISKPYLTVVGGIQPNILPTVLGKEQLIFSGFNYRWLFVMPEIKISVERTLLAMPQDELKYWNQLIEMFFSIKPATMTFDDGAQMKLNDYFREIRTKKMEGNDIYMDEVRDKLFIYLEKWAALATLLHHGDDGETDVVGQNVITTDAVEYSIQCMHVFECWAEKVRNLLSSQSNKRQITLGEAIKTINKIHPIRNKRQFAESCGITREQLYKYLPRTEKRENDSHEVTPGNAGDADKQGG